MPGERAPIRLHARAQRGVPPAPPDDPGLLRARVTAVLSGLLGAPAGVVLTSSCTHALEAAATLLEVGPGDEVVVPAFTFPSTANAFLMRGARVRFADVVERTASADAETVGRCLTGSTRVVVQMHYAGVGTDAPAIAELARTRGIELVEDAAHGLFASVDGTPLGRLGRLSALSFHRTKNLSAHDGGALIVNDPDLLDAVDVAMDKGTNRRQFESGRVDSYDWTGLGSAWRLPDPLVCLLAAEVDRRDAIQARRHAVWASYRSELEGWATAVGARLPVVDARCTHPAHIFHILLPSGEGREAFSRHCSRLGVEAVRHYGSLPDSPFGRKVRHPDDDCPVARSVAARLVRIPLHHELSDSDVCRVIDAVISAPT